ncbi:hypothetical protein ACWEQL_00460 [Kitasatospora sp. NPDC004240]
MMVKGSIGTARHLHRPGTSGLLCRWHNRAALATTAAALARGRGLNDRATDAELANCVDEARGGPSGNPSSPETFAAI